MLVFKVISRSLPILTRIVIKNNTLVPTRSIFTQFLLSSKYSSPESSPIKNVGKKKRKISSSSEEDTPVAKKISSSDLKKSPKEKKGTQKKSPAIKKSSKLKTPEVKPSTSATVTSIKTESPENKPQNGQTTETVKESPKMVDTNVLKIQSADAKGADYNPGKKNYHPINDAFWKKGEK